MKLRQHNLRFISHFWMKIRDHAQCLIHRLIDHIYDFM